MHDGGAVAFAHEAVFHQIRLPAMLTLRNAVSAFALKSVLGGSLPPRLSVLASGAARRIDLDERARRFPLREVRAVEEELQRAAGRSENA